MELSYEFTAVCYFNAELIKGFFKLKILFI